MTGCENLNKGAGISELQRSHDGDSLRRNVDSRAHRLQALAAVLTAVQAPANLVEFAGHAGEQHQQLPQYNKHWQGQGHHEAGGQVETVGLLLKGSLPAKQQAVEGSNEQGNVAQSGLEKDRMTHYGTAKRAKPATQSDTQL